MPKLAAAARTPLALLCALALCSAPAWARADDAPDPAGQLALRSGLPVLCLSTQSGELPTDEDGAGSLTLLTADGGALARETAHIELNVRGNTSKRFPKKSYRVKIVDEHGEKQNLSIAGLRSDDDWILNPMYTDTSKLREALAYELWDMMNSSGEHAQSSRLAYAEVFLNGEYWGLYGVQERIDRKQVDGDKHSGVLYKVIANDRPTVDELLHCDSYERCRGFELELAGVGVNEPWKPAAAYMAALQGDASAHRDALSQANVIDYGLWAMLTQAHDCHFKNQFLNCVYSVSGYTMYKIPWDLNNTFGDVWRNAAEDTNFTGYHIGSLVEDGAFALLVASGDPQVYDAIRERWAALRRSTINEDALVARARALYGTLFDAIARDSERWPHSGMGDGNARNIRDIEDFIRVQITRMDEYIARLGVAQP